MRSVYRKQSGVTIVEVLFAIAIVVMGLMGIAALIMVAGAQLTQGLQADGMSNLGLNAVEELDMRHLRHQDSLTTYDPASSNFVNFQTAGSYCIDPYYIAQQIQNNNTNIPQFNLFPGVTIPSGNPDRLAVMDRVTLINAPGIINDPVLYDPNTFGPGVARIMNKLQAQELFTSKDNLAMRSSDTKTELPQQVWFDDRSTPLANSARIADGIDNDHDGTVDEADEAFVKRIGFGDIPPLAASEFSWMVTVTPHRSFMVNRTNGTGGINGTNGTPPDPGTPAGGNSPDQYLISIVVFHNRVLNYNSTTLEDQERMLKVTLRSNGFGGGEVRLHSNNIAALDLKHGDWVMLSAPSELGPQFRWYKVTYIDDEVQQLASNDFYRDATLQGPDWNRREWLDATHPNYGPTHATFIPHVIGVFEKTIRIETTSLY
jgi:hypothetical protein